jgi:hypothetical protein
MVGDDVPCLQELILSFLRSPAYEFADSGYQYYPDHMVLPHQLCVQTDTYDEMSYCCHGVSGRLSPSAVYLAAAKGWLYVFRSLLDQAVPNLLHAVSRRGYVLFIELQLGQYGVDVNSKGLWHHTVFQAAAFGGYLKAVQILLEADADVNDVGGEMGSPLQAALVEVILGSSKSFYMLMPTSMREAVITVLHCKLLPQEDILR